MRNVLLNRPDLTRVQLERTRSLMDQRGRDWDVGDYKHLIPSLFLPDAGDRHVLAAAIAAAVPIIVTFNLRDFPQSSLSTYGVQAVHPDDFLLQPLQTTSEACVSAIRAHRTALKNPQRTRSDYLARLADSGLRKTAIRLETLNEQI